MGYERCLFVLFSMPHSFNRAHVFWIIFIFKDSERVGYALKAARTSVFPHKPEPKQYLFIVNRTIITLNSLYLDRLHAQGVTDPVWLRCSCRLSLLSRFPSFVWHVDLRKSSMRKIADAVFVLTMSGNAHKCMYEAVLALCLMPYVSKKNTVTDNIFTYKICQMV